MHNFDWRTVVDKPLYLRFHEWATGYKLWRGLEASDRDLMSLLNSIVKLRGKSDWGKNHLVCPRVFISHKKQDASEALAIAKIAHQQGFQYWLDILDPALQSLQLPGRGKTTKQQRSQLIAAIIEMALLNCTHVLAVFTVNTRKSSWVPYEYGRVKDSGLYSLQAACWIHPKLQKYSLPGYMHLGVKMYHPNQVKSWFHDEQVRWAKDYKNCLNVEEKNWTGGPTKLLPALSLSAAKLAAIHSVKIHQ